MIELKLEGDWLPILEEVLGWVVGFTMEDGTEYDVMVNDIEWDEDQYDIVWLGVDVTDDPYLEDLPFSRTDRIKTEPDIRLPNWQVKSLLLY